MRRRVHEALEKLPEHQRGLIELAYWRGLPQAEIAAQVGITLGTVKTRTRAALACLAALLEDEGAESVAWTLRQPAAYRVHVGNDLRLDVILLRQLPRPRFAPTPNTT